MKSPFVKGFSFSRSALNAFVCVTASISAKLSQRLTPTFYPVAGSYENLNDWKPLAATNNLLASLTT